MKTGTETGADKKDGEADPLAGFISGSYCFLPLAPFSARGVLIKEEGNCSVGTLMEEMHLFPSLFSEIHLRKVKE